MHLCPIYRDRLCAFYRTKGADTLLDERAWGKVGEVQLSERNTVLADIALCRYLNGILAVQTERPASGQSDTVPIAGSHIARRRNLERPVARIERACRAVDSEEAF